MGGEGLNWGESKLEKQTPYLGQSHQRSTKMRKCGDFFSKALITLLQGKLLTSENFLSKLQFLSMAINTEIGGLKLQFLSMAINTEIGGLKLQFLSMAINTEIGGLIGQLKLQLLSMAINNEIGGSPCEKLTISATRLIQCLVDSPFLCTHRSRSSMVLSFLQVP